MEREQAVRLTQNLLRKMVERDGSDLFITAGFPPAIKVDGTIHKATDTPLNADQAAMMVRSIMNDKQAREFDATRECNFAIAPKGIGRFRVSAFVQQGMTGLVARRIETRIPNFEELGCPDVMSELALEKRGIVLFVGATGTGKSTSMAAMVGYRNQRMTGHIITIEDPIEYLHPHKQCLVNQREVGSDTHSFKNALKYILRQDPDIVLLGELRDLETIEAALTIAETGHLCFATLHTNGAV